MATSVFIGMVFIGAIFVLSFDADVIWQTIEQRRGNKRDRFIRKTAEAMSKDRAAMQATAKNECSECGINLVEKDGKCYTCGLPDGHQDKLVATFVAAQQAIFDGWALVNPLRLAVWHELNPSPGEPEPEEEPLDLPREMEHLKVVALEAQLQATIKTIDDITWEKQRMSEQMVKLRAENKQLTHRIETLEHGHTGVNIQEFVKQRDEARTALAKAKIELSNIVEQYDRIKKELHDAHRSRAAAFDKQTAHIPTPGDGLIIPTYGGRW